MPESVFESQNGVGGSGLEGGGGRSSLEREGGFFSAQFSLLLVDRE